MNLVARMKTFSIVLALLSLTAAAVAHADEPEVTPTAGPAQGGAVVVLFGHDLSPDETVWFGGAPATHVEAIGDGMLEVEAPAGAGTVDVCVGTRVIPGAYRYDDGDPAVVTPCFPVDGTTTVAREP